MKWIIDLLNLKILKKNTKRPEWKPEPLHIEIPLPEEEDDEEDEEKEGGKVIIIDI